MVMVPETLVCYNTALNQENLILLNGTRQNVVVSVAYIFLCKPLLFEINLIMMETLGAKGS